MEPLLKNLYNEEYIHLLNTSIKHEFALFETQNFTKSIFNTEWQTRELKDRMRHIATTLGIYLPSEYIRAIKILKLVFKKMNFSYGLENMIFQGLHKLSIIINGEVFKEVEFMLF